MTTTKHIDMKHLEIVKAGIEILLPTPVDFGMVFKEVQRSENHVFWLQVPDTPMREQIATIKINGLFYRMTQRLEKAVFRNVRLTKDFINVEVLEDGTRKLRIPTRLLEAKKKSSIRGQVSSFILFVSVSI